ncbi:uncharacterized conserved secreted protein (DUF3721) [Synechococcus sp. RS9909]|nr:Predicted protein family [Synechococcus sp. RS9917]QNI79786.1 uncharacterized conserved secreted protein (DUF3721) [Synechococcus sp. RS9909]
MAAWHDNGVKLLAPMVQSPLATLLIALSLWSAGLLAAPGRAQHTSGESSSGSGAVKALYDTKAEAEAAAPLFNCKGAHAMGSKWMPCSAHDHGGNAQSGH